MYRENNKLKSNNSIREGRNEKMKKLIKHIICILAMFSVVGCGSSENILEYGETTTIEDVVELTFSNGGTFEKLCPLNAVDENNCKYPNDGGMFVVYGTAKNLSAIQYDLEDIMKVKVRIDDKYEADGFVCLENDNRTEFQETMYYESPITTIMQADTANCVIVANFSENVLMNAKEAEIEFKIKKDLNNEEEYKVYKMPLEILENE